MEGQVQYEKHSKGYALMLWSAVFSVGVGLAFTKCIRRLKPLRSGKDEAPGFMSSLEISHHPSLSLCDGLWKPR